ncbi:MAG TPA: aldo/keto reductase [Fimbriimonas sp.]|nr:aldo/keto reductase [Fimbriimonas sp.]
MLTTTLGKTGLKVSRMGLGCGGHSRLGMSRGSSKEEAARVVREAIDLGVNFIDTAEGYRTEEAVALGIADVPRDSVVLSTKVGTDLQDRPATAKETRERVDGCLRRLGTDYIDILHLHGVLLEGYPHALEVLYPELAAMRDEGKIRHIGITEAFGRDTNHRMLGPAVQEGPWEVVMVGFNLLNPSARKTVLPHTKDRGIGTLCMFAVRRALSNQEALLSLLEELGSPVKDLDFLKGQGVAGSIEGAAYRFCLWEPGMDVILSGTGNIAHLRQNAKALEGPPLSDEILEKLLEAFGEVDSVSGN